jgi:hypothetical protein
MFGNAVASAYPKCFSSFWVLFEGFDM